MLKMCIIFVHGLWNIIIVFIVKTIEFDQYRCIFDIEFDNKE